VVHRLVYNIKIKVHRLPRPAAPISPRESPLLKTMAAPTTSHPSDPHSREPYVIRARRRCRSSGNHEAPYAPPTSCAPSCPKTSGRVAVVEDNGGASYIPSSDPHSRNPTLFERDDGVDDSNRYHSFRPSDLQVIKQLRLLQRTTTACSHFVIWVCL
jgi:hypothetical protein